MTTSINYLEMNAATVKQHAKNLKIKNWWKLDKQSLLCDIASTLGWKSEDGIAVRDYLLSGKEVHVCPDSEIPAPRPARQDCAGAKVTPKEEKVKTTKRKPRKVQRTLITDSKGVTKSVKAPAKKTAKKTELPEGWVTLATLCEENDIKPTVARRRLRSSDAEKHETYGWAWERPASVIVKIIKGESTTLAGLTETPAPRKIPAKIKGEK